MQNKKKSEKNSLKDRILSIFFPEVCLGCEKSGNTLCDECLSEIKNEKIKNKNLDNLLWITSPLSYKSETLRKSLFALKYHHTKSVAKYLAKIVCKEFLNFIYEILENKKLAKNNLENLLLIPIPISKKRLLERDYNQSEILLREILKNILEEENINLENNLNLNILKKEKHTIKFSHTHSHSDREKLIKDAFRVVPPDFQPSSLRSEDENPSPRIGGTTPHLGLGELENKIIILFDDITTTGATFYETRNTLINFGIKKENIFGFAVAH